MGEPAVSGSPARSRSAFNMGPFFDGRSPAARQSHAIRRTPRQVLRQLRARGSTFRPVNCDRRTSPPKPIRCHSCATNQRRCCSSIRLSNRLIRRCSATTLVSSPPRQHAHPHSRTTTASLRPTLPSGRTLDTPNRNPGNRFRTAPKRHSIAEVTRSVICRGRRCQRRLGCWQHPPRGDSDCCAGSKCPSTSSLSSPSLCLGALYVAKTK